MASSPTPSLLVEIPEANSYRGTWDEVMGRILTQLDTAIAGVTTINSIGGTVNLTDTQYQTNQTRSAVLVVTGALGADVTLVVPARSKEYSIVNLTTGAGNVFIKTAAGDPMSCPKQGSSGKVRIAADNTIARLGPYVDILTGEITSSRYAFLSELAAEIDRATAEEATLVKLDGSRDFTAPVGGQTPTQNKHLATKQYVDSVSGINDSVIVTGGAAGAYTLTTGRDLTLTDGLTLSFRPHVTNTEGCTLNVDGEGAKPLRGFTGKALPAGVAIQGTPYRATYIAASQEWIFLGYFDSPFNIPIGGFLDYVAATPPNSYFVLPFGQAINRATYAALFNLIGTQFGAGNGATTFNLPDLRGRTVVGLDNMGGNVAGRVTAASGINGTIIGAAGGTENVVLARDNLPNFQLATSWIGDHAHEIVTPGTRSGSQIKSPDSFYGSSGDIGNFGARSLISSANGGHQHVTESINGNVPQTAVNKMPPSIILPKLLRVI